MNNDQQPKISPDYGYIMNQQSPLDKKSGVDKRIVIIIVCVLLMVVFLALSVLVKPSKGKVTSTTGPAAQQVIALNQAVQAKDYQKAASIMGSHLSDPERQKIVDELQKGAFVDINSCKVTQVDVKGDVAYVDNTCTTKDQKLKVTYTHTVVNSNGSYSIIAGRYKS